MDAATFHDEKVDPKYINLFFWKNGAGKSTVTYSKAFDTLKIFEAEYRMKMAALLKFLKNNLNDVLPKVIKTAEYEKLDVWIPLMNVIRRILKYYFLQLCVFDSSFFSTTLLNVIKKQIMDEVACGVPDYTKYVLLRP